MLQGIRATQEFPNPFLYQSIAMLAGDMGYIEEARQWYREGTSTLKGKRSLALWHGWAMMEATKVREPLTLMKHILKPCMPFLTGFLGPCHCSYICSIVHW